MSGCSGTPLAKKLGIAPGSKLFVADAPEDYRALFDPWPEDVVVLPHLSSKADVVHVFVTSRLTLEKHLRKCLAGMRDDAALWISWPKKSAKVATDITEDTIRDMALPMGLVDIKVCAVDDTWSGLKLVIRKANRKHRG